MVGAEMVFMGDWFFVESWSLGVGRLISKMGTFNFQLPTPNSELRRATAAGRCDDADGGVAGGDEAGGAHVGELPMEIETEQRGRAREAVALEPAAFVWREGRVWEEREGFHWEQGR
jgi:hypothetical protein